MKKLTLLINGLLAVTMLNAQPPPFQWAQGIGGISNDQGRAIAVDASGNVYTAGYFIGNVDFDPGPGQSNLTSYANSPDIFILKLNASGSFAWVKRIGGLSADLVNSMVIDPSGNIYTTGTFQGTVDFDPGPGSLSLISAGMSDIFVTKLDASGNFIWAKKIGGINQEEAYSIAVDDAGNVCTTGGFTDTLDFNPGPGVTNLIARGGLAAFILKLNSSGNFVWARSMDGDSSVANGTALKFDVSGNIHTTGNFYGSIDLDPGLDTFNVASDSWGDIFVLKLDSLGNFVWGKNIGLEESKSITLDVAGDIYVTGSFSGQIFVAKIDVTGNTIWTKILSVIATTGMDMSKGHSIVADESGHIYITGEFNGKVDFDPGAGTYSLTAPSQYIFYPRSDAFILKLDSDGYFQWAKQMGSEFDDAGLSLALDSWDNIYTTGHFFGTADFNPDTGIFNLTAADSTSRDLFIQKLGQVTTVDLNENIRGDNFLIYPNPNNGIINLDLKTNTRVIVSNTIGQEILNQLRPPGIQQLNVQEQDGGVYFIQLISDNKISVTKKIIKH